MEQLVIFTPQNTIALKKELLHIKVLFQRLLILLLLFSICRIIFYAFNSQYFPELTALDAFWIFVNGLRFDVASIIYINSLFILLHLIPNPYREKKWYQLMLKILFYTFNLIAFGFEASDFAYFRYSLKRITSDIVFMEHDAGALMPTFMRDFWYLFLLVIGMLLIAEFFYRKTQRPFSILRFFEPKIRVRLNYKTQVALSLVTIALLFIGARGGVQEKPINPNTPAYYVNTQFCPLAQNTPFTLMYSLTHEELKEQNYLPKEEANQLLPIHRTADPLNANYLYNPNGEKDNIVFIIIESWSKEYTGYFNPKEGYTPFLDSLMGSSLVFTNAYADAKKSIEGIPAVLSSLPTMMNDPLLSTERYENNNITSVATYLKKMGYTTSFFHGGSNGTMNFDKYTKKAGFDHYYGMNEYPEKVRDFDGNWGIFDGPFLQFFANTLNEQKQPFCSAVFTLTSHHPFPLPKGMENDFRNGKQPIDKVMQYTDYSLRQFFETASHMPWYNNTLFVITADHCGPPEMEQYKTRPGLYQVPIVLYKPGSNLNGRMNYLVQQCDILPTVLDYLKYKGSYNSFGESMLQFSDNRYAYSYLGGTWQIIDDNYALIFDGKSSVELYAYKTDVMCVHNLIGLLPAQQLRLETQLKAAIQQYNHAVLKNELGA